MTVAEIAAIQPKMVPLSEKYGYPFEKEKVLAKLKSRFPGLDHPLELLKKAKFSSIFIISTPFMWEPNLQIISDVLISDGGLLGTMRSPDTIQSCPVYYSSDNLSIPADTDEDGIKLGPRHTLGMFKICQETLWATEYPDY